MFTTNIGYPNQEQVKSNAYHLSNFPEGEVGSPAGKVIQPLIKGNYLPEFNIPFLNIKNRQAVPHSPSSPSYASECNAFVRAAEEEKRAYSMNMEKELRINRFFEETQRKVQIRKTAHLELQNKKREEMSEHIKIMMGDIIQFTREMLAHSEANISTAELLKKREILMQNVQSESARLQGKTPRDTAKSVSPEGKLKIINIEPKSCESKVKQKKSKSKTTSLEKKEKSLCKYMNKYSTQNQEVKDENLSQKFKEKKEKQKDKKDKKLNKEYFEDEIVGDKDKKKKDKKDKKSHKELISEDNEEDEHKHKKKKKKDKKDKHKADSDDDEEDVGDKDKKKKDKKDKKSHKELISEDNEEDEHKHKKKKKKDKKDKHKADSDDDEEDVGDKDKKKKDKKDKKSHKELISEDNEEDEHKHKKKKKKDKKDKHKADSDDDEEDVGDKDKKKKDKKDKKSHKELISEDNEEDEHKHKKKKKKDKKDKHKADSDDDEEDVGDKDKKKKDKKDKKSHKELISEDNEEDEHKHKKKKKKDKKDKHKADSDDDEEDVGDKDKKKKDKKDKKSHKELISEDNEEDEHKHKKKKKKDKKDKPKEKDQIKYISDEHIKPELTQENSQNIEFSEKELPETSLPDTNSINIKMEEEQLNKLISDRLKTVTYARNKLAAHIFNSAPVSPTKGQARLKTQKIDRTQEIARGRKKSKEPNSKIKSESKSKLLTKDIRSKSQLEKVERGRPKTKENINNQKTRSKSKKKPEINQQKPEKNPKNPEKSTTKTDNKKKAVIPKISLKTLELYNKPKRISKSPKKKGESKNLEESSVAGGDYHPELERDFKAETTILSLLGIENYEMYDVESLPIHLENAEEWKIKWKVDEEQFQQLIRFKILQEVLRIEERRATRSRSQSPIKSPAKRNLKIEDESPTKEHGRSAKKSYFERYLPNNKDLETPVKEVKSTKIDMFENSGGKKNEDKRKRSPKRK